MTKPKRPSMAHEGINGTITRIDANRIVMRYVVFQQQTMQWKAIAMFVHYVDAIGFVRRRAEMLGDPIYFSIKFIGVPKNGQHL